MSLSPQRHSGGRTRFSRAAEGAVLPGPAAAHPAAAHPAAAHPALGDPAPGDAAPAARAGNDGDRRSRRRRILALIVCVLIPINFEIAGVRLTPGLIAMICLFPALARQFLSGAVQWRAPDLLFLLYILWQALAMLANHPNQAVTFVGQQTLFNLTAYMAGRILVRDQGDFRHLTLVWAGACMISVPFALYEALTEDHLLPRLIESYTPFNSFRPDDNVERLGLYRAQFTLPHPIHYGLLGSLIIAPFLLGLKGRTGPVRRLLGGALIGFSSFLSVSSGAVLSILLQLLVFAWYALAARIGPGWRLVLASGGLLYLLLELVSNRNLLTALSTRLAFNSGNAFYRTLIWEYGTAQVRRTPLLGIGYRDWPRPSWMVSPTVDNYWLAQAIFFGLPAPILLLTAVLYGFIVVNRPRLYGAPDLDRLRLSWTLALMGLCMSASTVALWGEILALTMFFFGAGFWLAETGPGSPAPGTASPPEGGAGDAPRRTRYSRFGPMSGGDGHATPPRRAPADAGRTP